MRDELFEFHKTALQGTLTEPLCDEYRQEWRKCGGDKLRLVTLAMRQQSIPYFVTHCYNGKGLTKDYVLYEFADYINGYTIRDADGVRGYTYGLYVDYDYDNDLIVDKDVISVMWTRGTSIVIPETKSPVVYISNGSDVNLVCDGYNHPKIYLFDCSKVTIHDVGEESSVTVYRYSDDAVMVKGKFCLSDKINDFRKTLKL